MSRARPLDATLHALRGWQLSLEDAIAAVARGGDYLPALRAQTGGSPAADRNLPSKRTPIWRAAASGRRSPNYDRSEALHPGPPGEIPFSLVLPIRPVVRAPISGRSRAADHRKDAPFVQPSGAASPACLVGRRQLLQVVGADVTRRVKSCRAAAAEPRGGTVMDPPFGEPL